MKAILVVEDQQEISKVIIKYLDKEGYDHHLSENGFEALEAFHSGRYDLVLLDIMLPGIDGYEVLQNIRYTSDVPVIMLTAKDAVDDRIRGFDEGADDYVLKPFSPRELMRRIQAILKRVEPGIERNSSNSSGDEPEEVLRAGELLLNMGRMELHKSGAMIELTAAEASLLQVFMSNQGRVLTREQLINKSFGVTYDGYDRNIDSYIKRLRSKIEQDPKHPTYLKTKYGAGYIFGGDLP